MRKKMKNGNEAKKKGSINNSSDKFKCNFHDKIFVIEKSFKTLVDNDDRFIQA